MMVLDAANGDLLGLERGGIKLDYLVKRGRNEMRDVEDVAVHFGNGLGDVRQGPSPAGLQIVHEFVENGMKIGFEEIQQGL